MKQQITDKQLNELSEKGAIKLREWSHSKYANDDKDYPNWNNFDKENKYGLLPLLSIGQMIEFLDENRDLEIEAGFEKGILWWKSEELCDALWEDTKEALNE